MVNKIRNIRMDDETAKRLKLAAVEYGLPQGLLVKRLLDLLAAAPPALLSACIHDDADEMGEVVPGGAAAVDQAKINDLAAREQLRRSMIEELKDNK